MIYVDVNVLYYFLTAHPKFGRRSKELLEKYYGRLCTSVLTVWLLYILTKDKNIVDYLENLEIKLLPLTFEILKKAAKIKELDFEDAIHYATMKFYKVNTIISNDRDFDKVDVIRIF